MIIVYYDIGDGEKIKFRIAYFFAYFLAYRVLFMAYFRRTFKSTPNFEVCEGFVIWRTST